MLTTPWFSIRKSVGKKTYTPPDLIIMIHTKDFMSSTYSDTLLRLVFDIQIK